MYQACVANRQQALASKLISSQWSQFHFHLQFLASTIMPLPQSHEGADRLWSWQILVPCSDVMCSMPFIVCLLKSVTPGVWAATCASYLCRTVGSGWPPAHETSPHVSTDQNIAEVLPAPPPGKPPPRTSRQICRGPQLHNLPPPIALPSPGDLV